jgi:hypothetical protein
MSDDVVARAKNFVVFCDGLEEAGMRFYARRGRTLARDVLELHTQLAAARTSLEAMTADRDRWREDRWREVHGQGWPR